MQIIGIDVGRSQVKATNGIKEIIFKSIVGSHHTLNVPGDTDYDVSINGRKHFIGDLARCESESPREMLTESKAHEDTKILFLTALALLVDFNEEYKVYCGMPIKQNSIKCKSKLMEFISGKHDVVISDRKFPIECKDGRSKQRYAMLHDVAIEEKKVSVELNNENFRICPESVCAYYNEIYDNKGNEKDAYDFFNKTVRVIDIGRRAVNFCTMIKGKEEKGEGGSLNYGTMQLGEFASVTNEDKVNLAHKIIDDLSHIWTDYDNDTFFFTGGGSILLSSYLHSHYVNNIVSEDPLMANARGFYKMGVIENE